MLCKVLLNVRGSEVGREGGVLSEETLECCCRWSSLEEAANCWFTQDRSPDPIHWLVFLIENVVIPLHSPSAGMYTIGTAFL